MIKAGLQTRRPFADYVRLLSLTQHHQPEVPSSAVPRTGVLRAPATGQRRSTWTKQSLCSEDNVDTAYYQWNTRKIHSVSNESAKHKQLVNATADFICQGLQSLSVVDEPAFRHLLQLVEPRFNLPHRTYFTNTVIPAK